MIIRRNDMLYRFSSLTTRSLRPYYAKSAQGIYQKRPERERAGTYEVPALPLAPLRSNSWRQLAALQEQ
jgi:hypothetical protein